MDPRSVPPGAYGNWPGLNQTGELRVDRARLRAIAKRLESDLEEIIEATEDLQRANSMPDQAYGTWDAARNLVSSIVKGRSVLAEQHDAFLVDALQAIKMLRRTAQVYDDVESELERRVMAVRMELENAPVPSSDPSPRATDHPRSGPGSLR
ncbi:hypothetical protein [Actinomadura napierensis]|uniref:hypothetical protein n=1 Tax=Actinomadura napierensis TaxID=267854 RepID=UPI0031D87A14